MAGIVLESVSRVFPGGVTAIDQLDLEVLDGECLVLIGPSGCGKSTTLRLIAGLDRPTAGTIRIGGRAVNGVSPKDRNIALVFQSHVLYPHWNVRRNMAFGLELRERNGWLKRVLCRVFQPARAAEWESRRTARDERVRQVSRSVRVEHLLDRLPSELSGGERQRVALGRAIARQPAAFLFDEPLSNLDAALRVQLRMELKRLQRDLGTSMVWVTHDQTEALTLGDRVAVIDRGRLQQVGAPWDVYDRPANRFVAAFLGSAPMNLLEGEFQAAANGPGFRHADWWLPLAGEAPETFAPSTGAPRTGAPLLLGLRPEDLHLVDDASTASRGRTFSAVVLAVEPLGDASLMHLIPGSAGTGGSDPFPLVCKTGARPRWVRGDRVQVQADWRRAHLFDLRTGENLSRKS